VPEGKLGPLFALVQRMSLAVPEALQAQGTFVAMNNVVSQSVPHLHVHVVPRSKGDGLKGFFWPRQPYRDEEHMREVAAAVRKSLA
jgi:histidine triad (HIT) family protein